MNVHVDSDHSDDARRAALYSGSIFLYSALPSAIKLCELARELLEEAFRPHDPLKVQDAMPVEECVEILAKLKPAFIHHPRSKECIQGILRELRCDPEQTFFDVPRLRTAFPADYLSSGIAYAFHPHRDTWYSAPFCQVNWWMPVFDLQPENAMAFHPRYWSEGVRNSSETYNYDEWNKTSRQNAAQHIKQDTRVQPRALDPLEAEPQLRFLPKPAGLIVFSAAQMHSTVPNTTGVTRYSIDFRTVHLGDVWQGRGAPNQDSACTGTTLNDYLRITDLAHLPEEAIAHACAVRA